MQFQSVKEVITTKTLKNNKQDLAYPNKITGTQQRKNLLDMEEYFTIIMAYRGAFGFIK